MGFCQVGFELLTSGDLPALASQSAGILEMSHCTQPILFFKKKIILEHFQMYKKVAKIIQVPISLHSAFPIINILHNYCTFVKIKTLTLVQYY